MLFDNFERRMPSLFLFPVVHRHTVLFSHVPVPLGHLADGHAELSREFHFQRVAPVRVLVEGFLKRATLV